MRRKRSYWRSFRWRSVQGDGETIEPWKLVSKENRRKTNIRNGLFENVNSREAMKYSSFFITLDNILRKLEFSASNKKQNKRLKFFNLIFIFTSFLLDWLIDCTSIPAIHSREILKKEENKSDVSYPWQPITTQRSMLSKEEWMRFLTVPEIAEFEIWFSQAVE